jgi:phosphoserine/homoserine phosphotransferase
VSADRITGYLLRVTDQKRRAVAAFKQLNYRVIAAGDSYNDTAMLVEADTGFLVHAPENVKRDFPQFQAVDAYPDLLQLIQRAMA